MFLDDLDTFSIFERNVLRLESLELGQSKRLIKAYQLAKSQIVSKLLITKNNTFTEAKLELALKNIDKALKTMRGPVNHHISQGFDAVGEQGIEDSVKEVNKLEKHYTGIIGAVPIDTIIESVNPDNFLFNKYQASMDNYSQGLRNSFRQSLTQHLIQGSTWSQAVYEIEKVFTGNEWQIPRIVRTELHNLYSLSKLKGFEEIKKEYLPDIKKTLYHPKDGRTGEDSKQLIKENLIVDLNKPFVYTFNNKKRVFMTPPDRPNDRAILIPYRKSYDE